MLNLKTFPDINFSNKAKKNIPCVSINILENKIGTVERQICFCIFAKAMHDNDLTLTVLV